MINVGKRELKEFVRKYVKRARDLASKEEVIKALDDGIFSKQLECKIERLKEEFSLYMADNDYEIISLNADNLDRIKRVAKRYVDVDLEDDLVEEYLLKTLERIDTNE